MSPVQQFPYVVTLLQSAFQTSITLLVRYRSLLRDGICNPSYISLNHNADPVIQGEVVFRQYPEATPDKTQSGRYHVSLLHAYVVVVVAFPSHEERPC